MEKLNELFNQYEKAFKKVDVTLSDLEKLEKFYTISLETEKFEKLGRKNFPTKATSKEVEQITAYQYALYLSSIGFFGDRVEKAYTQWGYKPYKLTCTNPTKDIKIKRVFKFEVR